MIRKSIRNTLWFSKKNIFKCQTPTSRYHLAGGRVGAPLSYFENWKKNLAMEGKCHDLVMWDVYFICYRWNVYRSALIPRNLPCLKKFLAARVSVSFKVSSKDIKIMSLSMLSLPTISLPMTSLPTIPLPMMTLPTISLPMISLPTIPLPMMSLPTIPLPIMALPTI